MKKLFIAMAFALVTLTGCVQEDSIGHGDIYVAGHNGKVCTGDLKLVQIGLPVFGHLMFVGYCDNGIKIMDMKNVTLYHDAVKVDSTKFQEIFKE